MNQKSKSIKTSSLYRNKPRLFDDFTEDVEHFFDDVAQEMYFGEKIEQLDSDTYL